MAGGSYSQKPIPEPPTPVSIPPRATRHLQREVEEQGREEDERVTRISVPSSGSRKDIASPFFPEGVIYHARTHIKSEKVKGKSNKDTDVVSRVDSDRGFARMDGRKVTFPVWGTGILHFHLPRRHRVWLQPLIICTLAVVLGAFVLISASIFQRPGTQELVPFPGGQVYSIQVGGSVDNVDTWTNTTAPIPPRVPIHTGPYSVLGKPTITVAFINAVLASYHSPAAGKGQALYDLGVKYGIDPAFALAFFLHESSMGTTGVARTTLSLGNLRCIPDRPCVATGNNGYFAQMYSWEDGFEQFYKLIRNLYVAKWGLVTVDQIIPVYAPSSDHNDVKAYIGSLKHAIDTWHAGVIQP